MRILGLVLLTFCGSLSASDLVTAITPNADGSTTITIVCSNTLVEIAASKVANALPGAVKQAVIDSYALAMVPHLYAAVENLKAGKTQTSAQVDAAAAVQAAAVAAKAADAKAAQAATIGDPTK